MADRVDVRFPSGADECAAWLYLPEGPAPYPVIVMAHGLGAVREMRLDVYAERFRTAGYACLVFDYRHFGASGGEPRQLLSIGRQLEDWTAAIAYARGREELDADRVVLWGTSFGGGHVIVTAARDPRVAAAISQCPFTDGPSSVLAIDPGTVLRLVPRAIRDVAAAALRRTPVMVPTVGSPGATALMTAPDAVDGYRAIVPDGLDVREEVAARFALAVLAYRPGRRAAKVRCPILFCVCERDSVAPARATLRHARAAPRGEIRSYPIGHFDVYVGEPFEQAIADQLAFLGRWVPSAG